MLRGSSPTPLGFALGPHGIFIYRPFDSDPLDKVWGNHQMRGGPAKGPSKVASQARTALSLSRAIPSGARAGPWTSDAWTASEDRGHGGTNQRPRGGLATQESSAPNKKKAPGHLLPAAWKSREATQSSGTPTPFFLKCKQQKGIIPWFHLSTPKFSPRPLSHALSNLCLSQDHFCVGHVWPFLVGLLPSVV